MQGTTITYACLSGLTYTYLYYSRVPSAYSKPRGFIRCIINTVVVIILAGEHIKRRVIKHSIRSVQCNQTQPNSRTASNSTIHGVSPHVQNKKIIRSSAAGRQHWPTTLAVNCPLHVRRSHAQQFVERSLRQSSRHAFSLCDAERGIASLFSKKTPRTVMSADLSGKKRFYVQQQTASSYWQLDPVKPLDEPDDDNCQQTVQREFHATSTARVDVLFVGRIFSDGAVRTEYKFHFR